MRLLSKIITAGIFAATLQSTLVSAATIVNGSFEDDLQSAGTWNIYDDLTGWTGGDAGIELRNNVAGQAYDGVNFIELDTTRNSLASQMIGTANQWYDLSFAYSPRTGVADASNGIEVFWNSVSQGIFSGLGGNSGNIWTLYTISVLGTAPISTLEFRAVGTSDSYGGSLDAVSISEVPLPGTLGLLGLGLAALGSTRKRKAG